MSLTDVNSSNSLFASSLLYSLGNADKLDGLDADSFLRTDADSIPSINNSISLGSSTNIFKSVYAGSLLEVNDLNGIPVSYFLRRDTTNTPTVHSTDSNTGFDFGSTTAYWRHGYFTDLTCSNTLNVGTLYASQIYNSSGTSTFSHTLLSDIGTYSHTSIDSHINNAAGNVHGATAKNNANMIVRRDSTGSFYATKMYGLATSANYADLAEKYTCEDTEFEIGKLYCVSNDENYDVELCDSHTCRNVVGVVSENPGFILNEGIEGVLLGLKGKVKVSVHGEVHKGDILIPYKNGNAIAIDSKSELCIYKIGVANETNLDENVKLIEAIL